MVEDNKDFLYGRVDKFDDEGTDISQGLFFSKADARVMKQAAEKLGGISIENVGDTLVDGTKNSDPKNYVGLRVTRADGVRDLSAFWGEVDRLEAKDGEVPGKKSLLSRLRIRR